MQNARPGEPNADQIAYWNGPAAAPWVAHQARIDALHQEATRLLLDRAAPRQGEHVLDLGCGTGTTLLELAARVGPEGRVLGLDVSEPMLARARERIAAAGLSQVRVELADASAYGFAPGSFDLAFSRFGVMFFRDPVAAFAQIRRALKPEGRLVFVCFRSLAENAWVRVPQEAAQPLLPPAEPPKPGEPGEFAFADPGRVRGILEGAGFRDVTLTPHDPPIHLAGPGGAEDAAAFSTQMGPVARILRERPDLTEPVRKAMAEAYRKHDGPQGIVLPAAIWIVSARP
ncbi:MAG: class I SAM-dependent methyltransferase [Acetobacteraceae bacterium]|nr:class I SAM-dependent methyltransferase [Acetobacteraceae bacterium]